MVDHVTDVNRRMDHTATLLSNGKVLVAGGWNNGSFQASAELYDPRQDLVDNWNDVISRQYHTATRLQNNKVLVAGGAHW